MKSDEQRTIRILCVLGIIPVVWLALLVAPFVSGGLMEIVTQFPAAMDNPFHIELCEDSKKTIPQKKAVRPMSMAAPNCP